VEVELIEGDDGIFDVKADGRLLFSKQSEGRFPGYREIPKLLGAC